VSRRAPDDVPLLLDSISPAKPHDFSDVRGPDINTQTSPHQKAKNETSNDLR
jgi:hypothetical protein